MAWFTRGYCFLEGFFLRRENHFPFRLGWMSNRGRQNVASFLILDLQVDWRRGAVLWMISKGRDVYVSPWVEVQKTSNFCINYCLGCAFKHDFVILNSHCYLCLGGFPVWFICFKWVAQPTPRFVCMCCCLKRLCFLKWMHEFVLAEGSRWAWVEFKFLVSANAQSKGQWSFNKTLGLVWELFAWLRCCLQLGELGISCRTRSKWSNKSFQCAEAIEAATWF